MSGRGDRGFVLRILAFTGVLLGSVLLVFVLGGLVLAREVVPLEAANFPYTANVSGGVTVYMGPGVYRLEPHYGGGVNADARVCCLAENQSSAFECVNLEPGRQATISCGGPGIVICYNATVPPFHPLVGSVKVVKEWP
ncbi:MAG: hypothetical protein F7C35_08765 [Desulfurococcales archaeon]|nr:hypothetical protein [Desulfurococcales archaeon]